jgi:hypothetical protein
MVFIQWEPPAHDKDTGFAMSDLGLYMELGMEAKHAVQGSGTVVFRMESRDVLE